MVSGCSRSQHLPGAVVQEQQSVRKGRVWQPGPIPLPKAGAGSPSYGHQHLHGDKDVSPEESPGHHGQAGQGSEGLVTSPAVVSLKQGLMAQGR